ncbi:MAG TPA: hypothetical protein VHK69_03585 [Chitinophagaceae bacterium]|jgi:hypothetical protein|nr:hypothetical protein [Chitinophagaceae bacterium]
MKKILIVLVMAGFAACGSNPETGDGRREDMSEITDSSNNTNAYGNPGMVATGADSTPTSNNNAYNPDSASGQSSTYDTAARRNNPQQKPGQ